MLVCTNCVGFIENVENVSTSIVVTDNDLAKKTRTLWWHQSFFVSHDGIIL